ncbi:MAG: Amuc_1100 family pilus-like protein [Verrucomicrobiales bacterium]
MNWFQENKFYGTLVVVTALILVGGGVFCFMSYSSYGEAMSSYQSTRAKVESLKKQPLYPNKANLEEKEAAVEQYAQEAEALHADLAKFQVPLNPAVEPNLIQEKLRDTSTSIQQAAAGRVALPENFALGLEEYISKAPRKEASPILDFQIGAIAYLTQALLDANVTSIDSLERIRLPIEDGKVEPPPEPKTKSKKGKKPSKDKKKAEVAPVKLDASRVNLVFTGTQKSVIDFLNRIANTPESTYFFVPQVVRFDSERKAGPKSGFLEKTEVEDAGGIDVVLQDAQIILGNELIKVYAAIDIVRFPDLEEEVDPAAEGGADAPADAGAEDGGENAN